MKRLVRSGFVLVGSCLALLLLLSVVARAQGQAPAEPAAPAAGFSALGGVDDLLAELHNAGFATAEGSLTFADLVKMCCEGKIPNTLANNPWPNAYLVTVLPTPVGVNYPLAVPWLFQLRADEAVVMVGNTPPAVKYYSYQTFATSIPGLPGATGVAVGDTANISTVHTLGAERFNQPIVYILTANRTTEQLVRAAVHAAAYPDEIVNVETIAPVIAPPGYGPGGSTYYLAHRATVAESQDVLNAYIKNPPYRVFRVTPNTPIAADPEPVPVLRVQGTGHTEMEPFPAVRRLRQAILDKYAGKKAFEYRTTVQIEDPYVGLQQQLSEYGATRDTNYLSTPNFVMPDTLDQFVIVYGVNHGASGKAVYASISVYADATRLFGIDTIFDRDYAGSAAQYLPAGDPDVDKNGSIKGTDIKGITLAPK